MLNQLTKVTKAAFGDDPSSIGALIQPPGGSGSSSHSNSMLGQALTAALSSAVLPGTEAAAQADSTVPHRADQTLSLLVQGIQRTNSITHSAPTSHQGSVAAAAAASSAMEMSPEGPSVMELLLKALGSSPGYAAARPGAGGSREVGCTAIASAFAGASVGVQLSAGGSGLSVGEGRMAERWQAVLLTCADAGRRKSRDAAAAVEREMKKEKAAAHGGDGRDPMLCSKGWEEGNSVYPSGGSLPSSAPNIPLENACYSNADASVRSGSTAECHLAACGSVVLGGGMLTGGCCTAVGSVTVTGG